MGKLLQVNFPPGRGCPPPVLSPPCPFHWCHEGPAVDKKGEKMPNSVCLTCPAQLCVFCPSAQGAFPLIQTLPCIVPHFSEIQCQTFDSVFIHAAKRKMDFSVCVVLPAGLAGPSPGQRRELLFFYSSRQSLLENRKSFQHPKACEGHRALLCSG